MSEQLSGPKKGADRAVLLAHGAGTGYDSPPLIAVADALAAAKIPALRFDFPYRAAGKKAPDRAPVLLAAVRQAAASLAKRTGLPLTRIVVGGRSMGGRMCSMAIAGATPGDPDEPMPALGLVLHGYPLHPAGRPEQLRTEHLPRVRVPTLFVSGTKDSMGSQPALTQAAKLVKGRTTMHWLDQADHGFKVPRSTGRTNADVLDEVAAVTVEWVLSL